MKKRNADFWHWYPNSYPINKGIHFSFATMNFALRFMRKFKTEPFFQKIDITGKDWYTIKMPKQETPTDEQYTWLKRCKIDKKEKPMQFEEFKRGYKIYQGPKPKEGKHEPVWYVQGLDYKDGHGYYAYAGDEKMAIWTLKQTFESLQNRGEL